jgi:hypothetical protein
MRRKFILISLVVLSICSLIAQTATRKPGDTLIYEVVAQVHISGGHLPPQAYAPQPVQNSAFKLAVTSVEPAGTALVHVVIDHPFPEKEIAAKLPGGPLAAARNHTILESSRKEWADQNRYKEFDARLTRDGALLMAVDNSPQSDDTPKSNGFSQADLAHFRDAMVTEVHSPAYQAKLAENEAAGTFTVPNVIALSCAKKTSFAAGDAWHVVSKTDLATYDVTVTGKELYRGHETVRLGVKSHNNSPNGSGATDATVYYDPQSRMVIGMHIVVTSIIQVTGMTSSSTSDVNLKE